MKFYGISYVCDSAPDGYIREYFTSKSARRRRIAEIRREHRQETREAKQSQEAGELYPAFPVYNPASIHQWEMEFSGTPKKMVLAALRFATHNA